MPRNPSGTYTLPVGNPVVSGTLIEASWANNTLADIGNEVTDSLSRSGEGAMLAPLRLTDGAQATPSLAFSNETQSGLYRAGVGEWWAVASGVQVQQYTSTGAVTRFAAGAVGTPSVSAFNDVNTGIWFPAADTVALSTAGAEALRVNSSGVLSLVNNPTLSGGTANGVLYLNASKVATSGAALVFDGTNLGLGVTPSAQGAYRAMQFGDYLAIGQQTTGTSQAFFGWNVRGSSTINQYLYNKTGDVAALYEIFSDASHNWYTTSTAGTAGNTVSFGNPKMVLNASGNLGLGVTPSPWGSNFKAFESAGASSIALAAANINGVGIISNAYATNANWLYSTTGTASRYSVNTNIHQWQNAVSGTANSVISWATLMTLDANGNLGINVTPAAKLHVDSGSVDEVARFNSTGNPYISVHDSGVRQFYIQSLASDVDFVVEANKALSFYTNNTKRVSITALGSVVTGNGALATTATDGFLYVPTCAGTPTGTPTAITGMAPIVVNTTNNKLYFYSGGSWRDAGP
jgi:hypothetical protein